MNTKKYNTVDKALYQAYMEASTPFNYFYGPATLVAQTAFCNALDQYEGSKEYRFAIKRGFKQLNQAWREWWGCVKFMFEDKYAAYLDYCNKMLEYLEPDVDKLYWAVNSSLKRRGFANANRLAYVIVADILTHTTVSSHRSFVRQLVEKTKMPRLRQAFEWADLTHLMSVMEDLRAAIHPGDIELDDSVDTAVHVIGRRLVSERLHADACIGTLEMDEHADMVDEETADAVEACKAMRETEEREADEANRRYWEQKQQAKARKPTMSGKAIAEKLSERYKVTRA
jgi:hypothetical protein